MGENQNQLHLSLAPIYLTTAISYTNGSPHIGHAYESISADIMSRYHSLVGRPVYFLTGTDEHGQKIARTAESLGVTAKELCDKNSSLFKKLNEDFCVDYDRFIRTTEDHHKKMALEVFKQVYKKGDIYLGEYHGWYNSREERFITDIEAASTNYMDPVSNNQYEKVTEPSFFFCLEKYRQKLIDHINSHPKFIFSESKRNEILKRLEEPLQDLSISRTSFDWGIQIPKMNDECTNHVMYVWFDALTNYLSGRFITNELSNLSQSNLSQSNWGKYGPPIHIIGQDIVWFHAVIWSCILMSIDFELPQSILIHGFINDSENRKMSKSLGNIVDPNHLLRNYSSDTIRYYFIRAGSYGSDIKFSEEILKEKNDNELADCYGNLVNRVLALTNKYCNSKIPNVEINSFFNLKIIEQIDSYLFNGQLSNALEIIVGENRLINQWLTESAPWKLTDLQAQKKIVKEALEKLYILTHLFYPFIPTAAKKVIEAINHPFTNISRLSLINLSSDIALKSTKLILFEKFNPSFNPSFKK